MSMFYELMMRKKEEIMYATIKGTLTENDGVFSGFSASNYLALQQEADFSSNFETQVSFKINNYSPCGIMCLNSYDYKGWHCIGSNLLAFSLKITDDNNSKFIRASFTVSTNTSYIANAKRIGNNVICSLYSNGVLLDQQTLIIDEGYHIVEGVGYNIGKNVVGYFDGSIDLNQSYIKLGSTKYNLQAVVGYTVVGSPTITDGVVSGFSKTNYLKIPKPTTINEFELNIKFRFSSLSSYQFLFGDNVNDGIQLQKHNDTSNTIRFRYCNGSISTNISIFENPTINKDYIINVKVKGTKAFVVFEIVGEEKFTQEYNLDYNVIFGTGNWLLGRRNIDENASFIGSIDLNETYIKINNKLWFNGQQA